MFKQEKIDKLYPGATIYGAMKFWQLPKNKTHMLKEMCENGNYYGQTKKDGNWYEFSKSADGTPYLFSRGASVKTGLPVEGIEKVPHLAKAFEKLPNNTIILGEVYYPGETTAAVRSIMGCLPPKAIARQKEKGNIHFYMFDMLMYDGEDMVDVGSLDRFKKLTEIVEEYDLLSNEIELADCVTEDLYEYVKGNFANGEEGSILKKKDSKYLEGKKPAWSSIKCKKQDDIDVVCMGFEDPTKIYTGGSIPTWQFWEVDGELREGSYYNPDGELKQGNYSNIDEAIPVTKAYFYGWKMSIKFGLYKDDKLIQVGTVSSGMNDALRQKSAENPEDYIGKVMKLNYMELTDDAVREPIFIEFREDKMAEECLYTEVFK